MSTRIHYEDLKFENDTTDNTLIKAHFIKNFYFHIPKTEIENIGEYKLENGDIIIEASEKRAQNKISLIIDKGIENLYHKIRNKRTIYIHQYSGIPLIGTNEFGLVDRGSNIIEVKPLTGCNLNCIFCSVNEGINQKKDIIVECEYLVDEFRKLAKIKEHPIEANIGPQGEPLLYPKLVELIREIKNTPNVETISINTNGATLNPKLIDELAEAGLSRINLSLHALKPELIKTLMDGYVHLPRLLENIKYCEGKIDVLLAPVLIPGMNDEEIDGLIELSKTIKNKKWPSIGIQNFLNYKGGRNPVKQISWEKFYEMLKEKEKKHGVQLIVTENIFNIHKDKTLPKPFKKGQIITAEIKSEGRNKNEKLAQAQGRCITVIGCKKEKGETRLKLIRDKHNIYTGIAM